MNNAMLTAEFAKSVGLDTNKLFVDGICTLTIGDDVEIVLMGEPDGYSLVIDAVLMPLTSRDPELLLDLLASNHDEAAVGQAALALNKRTHELVLRRHIATEHQTVSAFSGIMEDMAKRAMFWMSHVDEMERNAVDSGGMPLSSSEEMIVRV